MTKVKLALIVCLSVLVTFGLSGTALAFHGGGVAHCDGCHTMHNSAANPIGSAAVANSKLLKGTDSSSTCLNCHNGGGGYHVASTDGSNKSQGGDFYWVKNPWSVTAYGSTTTNGGHNIVAADYAFSADADVNRQTAPGGTYAASKLGCTSCHDAHGQVNGGTKQGSGAISVSGSYGAADPTDGTIHGNYRLLGDAAYVAGDHVSDGYSFNNAAPVARANASNGTSVDYGSGMSEWCANCHNGFLAGGSASHKHPAGNDVHLNGFGTNYNSYVSTGNFTGDVATSYDSLVPFERGQTDGSLLDPTNTIGPDANSNVSCLTCHRSHASAHPSMGRWDFAEELLAESHALELQTAGTIPATAAVYYKNGATIDVATAYGTFQRSLCNKCHVQD